MIEAFSWEFADRREKLKLWRRFIEGIVLISAFSLSGAVAQGVIYYYFFYHVAVRPVRPGFVFWVANCFFVLASLFLLCKNLMDGREKKSLSDI